MADSRTSLRRKIDSAGDLQSVVRAMKAQAAASVGQYERSVTALGDYARTVELGLGACLRQHGSSNAAAPPRQPAKVRVIRAVVFGSDQGLVGRFNDIVVELAHTTLAALPGTAQVWAVGERARSGLADNDMSPRGVFAVPGSVHAITALVGQILSGVALQGGSRGHAETTTELRLFYNRPTSASSYAPVARRLLPLDDTWRRRLAGQPWPTSMPPQVMGDEVQTLRALIGEYLFVSIFRACAESLASENASRLAAMERADRNIDKLLVTLGDTFHRLRQTDIDEELSEVLAGFKALQADA
jgi:F-type H+-transporting ATPase subunit gamma